jgi:Xaa-Pro aminopeptidase
MRQFPDALILVIGGAPESLNPNFVYLTGIPEPRGTLLLAPEGARVGIGRSNPGPDYVRGRTVQQVLFLPSPDPLAARWGEDSAATTEGVDANDIGVDAVLSSSGRDAELSRCFLQARRLAFARACNADLGGGDDADATFIAQVARRFLNLEIVDATAALHEMRRLKSDEEVQAIEQAVAVTAEALDRATSRLRPGMREYEVEAEIARVYRAHGATHAFDPIVACGANALSLHYGQNNGPIEAGKLLLIDTGASLAGYNADITRTVPVDGRFSPAQRKVYEAVLAALEEAIAHCKPGAELGELHARAYGVIDDAGYGEHFIHGLGHHIGLETHDVGDIHRPLQAGAVVTIEPGIYLPGGEIGVRIEDDVLITGDGCRVLTEAVPKTVDAVERWMERAG